MDAEQLRDHFNRHAADFDRLYDPRRQSPWQRWLNRHFRRDIAERYILALEHVRQSGAESVLDVGCGPGHYLAALAKIGVPRLVGIDLSGEMIALARSNPDVGVYRNVELIQANYLEWEPGERFDVILAMGFFDYVAEPVSLLQKMRSEARHSVFAAFPSRHWFRTPFRWTRRRLQGTRVYFYSDARIRGLARQAGFRAVKLTRIPGAGMNILAELMIV